MTSTPYYLAIEVSDGKDETLGITNRITVNISKPAPSLFRHGWNWTDGYIKPRDSDLLP